MFGQPLVSVIVVAIVAVVVVAFVAVAVVVVAPAAFVVVVAVVTAALILPHTMGKNTRTSELLLSDKECLLTLRECRQSNCGRYYKLDVFVEYHSFISQQQLNI